MLKRDKLHAMSLQTSVETFAESWVEACTRSSASNTTSGGTGDLFQEYSSSSPPMDSNQMTQSPPLVTTLKTRQSLPPQISSPSSSSMSSLDLSPSASSTRSLPIHCIIEQTSGSTTFDSSSSDNSTHTAVELDSYAILPGTTLLTECVHSALQKLGYNSPETLGAKGAIQVKNWKPLGFDVITDNKTATIEDILGELTQVATLRIRICSAAKITSAEEVKEKLLQLLLSQSQSLLANAGCPLLDKNSSSTNGHTLATISPEMRRAFDRWYEEQLKSYTEGNGTSADNMNLTSAAKELLRMQQERLKIPVPGSIRDTISNQDKNPRSPSSSHSQMSPPVSRPTSSSTPSEMFSHPAYQHYLPGKTRMRTSFDPEHEIPRLQRWFSDNQHPSREQMIQYLHELNSLDSRKGRRPLDLTNIIYWFKNARAAHRRATKTSGDDSFETEDEKEPATTMAENYPFLPNRNAVYMVPYPHYPNLDINTHLGLLTTQSKINGQIDDREPCDLSMNSRSRSPEEEIKKSAKSDFESKKRQSPMLDDERFEEVKIKVEKEDMHVSPSRSDEGYSEAMEKSPPRSHSPQECGDSVPECTKSNKELDNSSDMPKDLTVEKPKLNESSPVEVEEKKNAVKIGKDLDTENSVIKAMNRHDSYTQDRPKDLSNGKRKYESDDDDFESDYDDDRSMDGSVSSHEEKMSSLRDSYINSARGLNFNAVTSSPSGQPLHIPQFPHPLAMHYFPLNTHFYSQQANQMKFHNQHSTQSTTPKSSPGPGQENNNSHRKRRTRVFIDPLSEIPKLEKWFLDDTHPSSYMIDKYCEELNSSEYRQKFPKLEPKNVQLWFKNHRAKVKRMRVGGFGDHQIFS